MDDHVHDAKMPPPPTKSGDGRSSAGRWGRIRRVPVVAYILSVAQVAVFIAELVKAAQLTGLPIQTQPQFNPLVGPSQYVLISMGARFDPCMRNVAGVQDATTALSWPCPNSTTAGVDDAANQCTLSALCGFGGGGVRSRGSDRIPASGRRHDKPYLERVCEGEGDCLRTRRRG